MSVDDKADYYDIGGIEVIDVIKAKLSTEGFMEYLLGNIIKYACRAGHKPNCFERDIEKITSYSRMLTKTVHYSRMSTKTTENDVKFVDRGNDQF